MELHKAKLKPKKVQPVSSNKKKVLICICMYKKKNFYMVRAGIFTRNQTGSYTGNIFTVA